MADDIAHLPKSMEKNVEEKRQRWHSTVSFILAAVGSAVGLGNVWRFPYLVSKNGGAPFLIPYILCLVFIGMPILLLELGLGQMFQGGDIEAFGRMHGRLRGIGLASVFGSFIIVTYYMVVLSYAGMFFVASFMSPLPYGITGENITFADVSGGSFFFNDVLNVGDYMNPTFQMNGGMVLALAIIWILVYCSIFNGVETAGWVVYVTVPLPVILIVVLLIRGSLLEGADSGVTQYIGHWNGTKLSSSSIWVEATGQTFFTLSVCMGVMTAYSSHNTVKHQVGRDEKIISLSDLAIALIGGFTVYTMLGHLEFLTGTDEVYSFSSITLAFVAYPVGISQVAGSNFWGVLFFLCLVLLGVDSAFSMVEAVTTVITDSWIAKRYNLSKPAVSMFLCLVGFALGTMYTMDVGLFLFDAVDHYVNSWGMIFLGFMECVSVGWFYKMGNQFKKVGVLPVIIFNLSYLMALALGVIIGLSLNESNSFRDGVDDPSGAAGGIGFAVGFAVFIIGTIVSILLFVSTKKPSGPSEILWGIWGIMGWHGVDRLRKMINGVDNPEWRPMNLSCEIQALIKPHFSSIFFGFFIKYLIPTILWTLFFTTFRDDVTSKYEGYPIAYQIVGYLIFATMLLLVVIVAIFPRVMVDPKQSGEETFRGQLYWILDPTLPEADKIDYDNESEIYGGDEDTVKVNPLTATEI